MMFEKENKSQQLMIFINSLSDFTIQEKVETYIHMGALITDAILQQGLSYETVVKPRVEKLQFDYPNAATISGFIDAYSKVKLDELIQFSNQNKLSAIENVSRLLQSEKIETIDEFIIWFKSDSNKQKLVDIKYIGSKTIDYFAILIGIEGIAVDRHLFKFLEDAGIHHNNDYHYAQSIIKECASLLTISESILDHSIWKYMSEKSKEVKVKTFCK